MGDQYDEPPPPGVQSVSWSSFNNASSLSSSNPGSSLSPLGSDAPTSSDTLNPQYIQSSQLSPLQPMTPTSNNPRLDSSEDSVIQPHGISNSSSVQYESFKDIEAAAQTAVLHEQEHLLKITTLHRTEMAVKRGKPTSVEEGNLEIVNGCGVPGGGAYYGAPILNEKKDLDGMTTILKNTNHNGESGQNSASKDLPEYLKKKLRARGIQKNKQNAGNHLELEHRLETQSTPVTTPGNLPPGWIEA